VSSNPLQFDRGTQYMVRLAAGTFDVPGKGEFNQIFASGCFDGQIRHVVGMTINGGWIVDVRIIAADVAEDGQTVDITYEVI
jgi:hypothetical protein